MMAKRHTSLAQKKCHRSQAVVVKRHRTPSLSVYISLSLSLAGWLVHCFSISCGRPNTTHTHNAPRLHPNHRSKQVNITKPYANLIKNCGRNIKITQYFYVRMKYLMRACNLPEKKDEWFWLFFFVCVFRSYGVALCVWCFYFDVAEVEWLRIEVCFWPEMHASRHHTHTHNAGKQKNTSTGQPEPLYPHSYAFLNCEQRLCTPNPVLPFFVSALHFIVS